MVIRRDRRGCVVSPKLMHTLRNKGGGIGMFTGCAAGDTGAALVLRVD